jgi:alcohol dehydrogenase class IV
MSIFRGNFELYFDESGFEDFIKEIRNQSYKNLFILYDKNIGTNLALKNLTSKLDESFPGIQIIEIELIGEPDYQDLDNWVNKLRNYNIDLIIAIGGGSLIDLCKGLSILLTNPGKGLDYRGMNKVLEPGVPLAAVPTTAGTGTEMTWTASFVDKNKNVKLGINGKNVYPKYGVLVPELLLEAPKNVLVSSVLDVLVHAIESVTSTNSHDFSKTIGIAAVNRVFKNYEDAIDKRDTKAILQLQIAAAEAGLAMLNSSGGPASGISYPVGVHYKVPHGFAGGILLPKVIKLNIKMGYEGYEVFDDLKNQFDEMYRILEVPENFYRWGLSDRRDAQLILDKTITERNANIELNPVKWNSDDLENFIYNLI